MIGWMEVEYETTDGLPIGIGRLHVPYNVFLVYLSAL